MVVSLVFMLIKKHFYYLLNRNMIDQPDFCSNYSLLDVGLRVEENNQFIFGVRIITITSHVKPMYIYEYVMKLNLLLQQCYGYQREDLTNINCIQLLEDLVNIRSDLN